MRKETDCVVVSAWYIVPRGRTYPLFIAIAPGQSPSHAWRIWKAYFGDASGEVGCDIMDRSKYVARRFTLTLTPYEKD